MTLPPLAILAGGRATRLGQLASARPKALVEVAGRPFVDHQLDLVRAKGVDRVVLCVGHLGDQIEDHVGDGRRFGLQVGYSRDGDVQRGTGGALDAALPMLGDTFLVLYGDAYLNVDYGAIYRSFAGRDVDGVMTVYRNDDRFDRSNVALRDGMVAAYDKAHPVRGMHHIDYGLSVLTRKTFESVPHRSEGPFDLADVFGVAIRRQRLGAFEVTQRFYEVGSVAGLAEADAFLSASLPAGAE